MHSDTPAPAASPAARLLRGALTWKSLLLTLLIGPPGAFLVLAAAMAWRSFRA